MEGEEEFCEELPQGHTAPPSPLTEKYSDINLLGDILSYQEGGTESQQLSLAKSLEDLRLTKDPEDLQAKFSYQVKKKQILHYFRKLNKVASCYRFIENSTTDSGVHHLYELCNTVVVV